MIACRLHGRADGTSYRTAGDASHAFLQQAHQDDQRASESCSQGSADLSAHLNVRILISLPQQVPKQPVVFLFTDKIAVPSLYKALSADYHNSFTFYTIKDDPEFADMKNTFGITKTPTLLLWKGADEIEMYGGPLKIGHISHWLKQAVKKQRKPDFDATKDEL